MIDPRLVTRKITLISGDYDELIRLSRMTLEEYLADRINELVAERLLERVIGRMIDINYHLITESDQPPPSDYYGSFLTLGELGILPPDLARSMAACAGLRNRIVHEYEDIDPQRVHEGLRAAVRDFPEYLRRINDHISTIPPA